MMTPFPLRQHNWCVVVDLIAGRTEKEHTLWATIKSSDKNISTLEKISSHTNHIVKTRGIVFFVYYKLYRNYLDILTRVVRKKYPIDAILRNGHHVTIHDYSQMICLNNLLSLAENHSNEVEYDIKENKTAFLSLPYWNNNSKVTLYGSITDGDAAEIFLGNIYENLPVAGKTVIDIGANIADSSIYFAVRGAKKVVALEPFPQNYEIAKRNIKSNNLSDKIILLLAGCAANQGFITINPFDKVSIFSSIENSSQGLKVPLLTLGDILEQNNLQSGELHILKMDCEGCEYESLLSASREVIRSFSHMLIEYHYGYKNLKYKLEENGFIVSVGKPTFVHPFGTSYRGYNGFIYAKLV
jgi:FkbM family methyltransferase